MANTRLIEEYIRTSGYKLQYIAQGLGISTNALHQKLLGNTQFKLNEAEKLSAILGMTMLERDACFFDNENRITVHMMHAKSDQRNGGTPDDL